MKGLLLVLVSLWCCIVGANAYSAPSVWETTVDSATDVGGCSLAEAMQSMNTEVSVGGCVLTTSSATQPFSNLILIPSSIDTRVIQGYDAQNAFVEYTNIDPLTIRGVGGKAVITRSDSALESFRFISVRDSSLTLENLIFSEGSLSLLGSTASPAGGALSIINSDLTVRNSDFLDNEAKSVGDNANSLGGAIFFSDVDGSDITIVDSRFIGNAARVASSASSIFRLQLSGAIEINRLLGTATITDTVFQANVAETDSVLTKGCEGGAVRISSGRSGVVPSSIRPNVVILRSAFINNTCYSPGSASTSNGGALRLYADLNVSILDSTFSGNQAGSGSALSSVGGQKDLSITNSTFTQNLGPRVAVNLGYSHAASDENSKLFITNSIIAGNLGIDGSLSSGKNIFVIYDNKTTFSASNTVFGSSEVHSFNSHNANPSYDFSQNDNLILTSDGAQATAFDDLIRPLKQGGTSHAHHPLTSGSPAIDAAAAFVDTFTLSSPGGPQTVYTLGCRGTETVIQSASLPPPPFRLDQLRAPRFAGQTCDIGPVEFREDFCFPIIASNGKSALVCL